MSEEATEPPHYLWTKSDTGNDRHYKTCCSLKLPSVFVSKHGKKYAYVAYDSLSMYGGDLKKSQKQKSTTTKVMKFYKEYTKTFGLPEDAFQAAGGENAFGFVVLREHAAFVPEGLFHFLLTKK